MTLLSRLSAEVLTYIHEHRHADVTKVLLGKSPFAEVSSRVLADQIVGRRVAERKFPFLSVYSQYRFPTKTSVEQSSSQWTAEYKAHMVPAGQAICDLTGGMGVDTLVLSRTASSSTYVERDDELCQLARYNFELLDADVAVVHSIAEDYLHTITEGQYDWLYIDPSRRVAGNKKTTITNLEPDLCAIEQQMLAVAPHILVKLSPMQDISEAIRTLSAVREVHIVSVSHDVKELLVVQERGYVGEVSIVAVDLTPDAAPSVYTATSAEMHSHCAVGPVQSWLYQPQPAVVKAQLHDHQARAYGLTKLHANTQLYSSAVLRSDYSGRIFEVMGTVPMQQKAMRSVVPSGKANIISKNHPLTPAQIAQKLKLVQGGQDYLIAATDYAEQKVLLHCNRIQ